MAALPALRHVACVAALNATAQGLVGVVLSVLALCVGFCALGTAPESSANDFAQYLTYYLQGNECGNTDYNLYTGITNPTALRVWMALSLFFSASMMASSLVMVVAVAKRWSDEKMQITLVSWLFINSFTAVDDLILGYVFGSDFLRALDSTSKQNNVASLALGVVTFLSVRGVYLWLLNLAFIIYLLAGARKLHKHLNEQLPSLDQEPIESWPTLDDFGKMKGVDIDRTPTAVNTTVAERVENEQHLAYPEHTAMARWPTLNGQAQTVRESRLEREDSRDLRAKTMREYGFRRQEGVDNPAYEEDRRYYLRLESETGSTRDYEDVSSEPPRKRKERDQPRNLKRATSDDSPVGQYTQKTPDPWRENPIPPPPSDMYLEENGIHIPPVDYLDPPENEASGPASASSGGLSLQAAILDRTLRLKKVPDELKKGVLKY